MPQPTTGEHLLYLRDDELRRAIELLFYAYRDFTAEPDAILATFGMGRAHHRAIYFIGRYPGISVSELLAILKITKQSLARVLNTLLAEGYVVQEVDAGDRRRRRLTLTPKAEELERRLTAVQSARIARAYREAGPEAVAGFCRVLGGIIGPEDRQRPDQPRGGRAPGGEDGA